MIELTAEQARVVGSLIEKELATPQQYPLTLNSLVLACNQTSNREPVVSYSEREVDDVLTGLKDAGLVRFVHPMHGGRVTKYRQVLHERLDLETGELALLGVLMLRGPQTLAELRTRTERLAAFASTDEVEAALARLAARDEPLVRRFEHLPGTREARYVHLLSGDVVDAPVVPASAPSASRSSLADEVESLRRDLDALRADFDALRASFE